MSFGDRPPRFQLVVCRTTPRKDKLGIVMLVRQGQAMVWWFSDIPNDMTLVNWYDIREARPPSVAEQLAAQDRGE